MKLIKTANGKIKMSKSEWQSIGKKAGWIKKAQGRMDRNEEEMYSTTGEPLGKRGVTKIKDDIAKLVDGFDENLMSKENFE